MIKLRINELLGDRSRYWLAMKAKVEHHSIQVMVAGKASRISLDTIDKLCDALECEPGDLIVKVPNASKPNKPKMRA